MNHSDKHTGLVILLIGIMVAVIGTIEIFSFLIIDIIVNNFLKQRSISIH